MDGVRRSDFDRVDLTADPADFVRYLDVTRATEFFQEIKRRSYALLALGPGDQAIDLGCGTGDDVRALAALVGSSGRAVGVDVSATMVAEARARHGTVCEFLTGDVQALAIPDATFDAVRSERVLQHVPDPGAALREIARIARPGARIVLWEADLDLFVMDAPDYDASRVMQRWICDGFRNGAFGHQLYRRLLELDLLEVRATPLTRELTDLSLVESAFDLSASVDRACSAGAMSPERGAAWLASLRANHAAGRFYCVVGGCLAFARKP